jgi:hypothetical protein
MLSPKHAAPKGPLDAGFKHADGAITPRHAIIHRGQLDLADAWGDSAIHAAPLIPQELVVRIDLPGIPAAAALNLDVTLHDLTLSLPGKFCLHLPLPFHVDSQKARAKFDTSVQQLAVTVPVFPPPPPPRPSLVHVAKGDVLPLPELHGTPPSARHLVEELPSSSCVSTATLMDIGASLALEQAAEPFAAHDRLPTKSGADTENNTTAVETSSGDIDPASASKLVGPRTDRSDGIHVPVLGPTAAAAQDGLAQGVIGAGTWSRVSWGNSSQPSAAGLENTKEDMRQPSVLGLPSERADVQDRTQPDGQLPLPHGLDTQGDMAVDAPVETAKGEACVDLHAAAASWAAKHAERDAVESPPVAVPADPSGSGSSSVPKIKADVPGRGHIAMIPGCIGAAPQIDEAVPEESLLVPRLETTLDFAFVDELD